MWKYVHTSIQKRNLANGERENTEIYGPGESQKKKWRGKGEEKGWCMNESTYYTLVKSGVWHPWIKALLTTIK